MNHSELPTQSHRITYLSADINYTFIYFTNAPRQLHCRSIAYCFDSLPGFVRIHKSSVVNPAFVSQVRGPKTEKMEVLVGKEWLPVSRRRKMDVIQQLQTFHQPHLLPGLTAARNF